MKAKGSPMDLWKSLQCSTGLQLISFTTVLQNSSNLHNFSISNINVLAMYEPSHDKTNKMTCAPSEDSDQPGHPPSLISLHCLHEEAVGPWLPIERLAKTLIRLGGCPGWSESLLGAYAILLVLSWGGSYVCAFGLDILKNKYFSVLTPIHCKPW